MLATEYHLKKQGDFTRAKTKGKILQRPWYSACIYDRKDTDVPRFGFVISTKISKLATQRNRIKRVMAETVRYNLKSVPKGVDVVFLVKGSMAHVVADDIQRELTEFLRTTDFLL